MGFHAELLMLYPKYVPQTKLAWEGKEIISFGHVTRLEKLTNKVLYPDIPGFPFDTHRRAGCCVMSCFFEKLWPKLDPLQPDVFAPQLVFEDHNYSKIGISSVVISPPESEHIHMTVYFFQLEHYRHQQYYQKDLREHNKLIVKTKTELAEYIKNNWHPIMHRPLLWEHCTTLAEWLDEAEKNKTEEWQAAEVDPVSLALIRAWREYFREIGKIGARALFLFPH